MFNLSGSPGPAAFLCGWLPCHRRAGTLAACGPDPLSSPADYGQRTQAHGSQGHCKDFLNTCQ